MDVPVDPFDHRWVRTSLAPRAARVAAGADPAKAREALLQELWPWAMRSAERAARHLPAHADRNELRSRMLLAVWEATSRIDWDRPLAWPSLLKQRLHGARVDAARTDDALSRRDRQAYRKLQADVATQEQRLGRAVRHAERAELATRYFPLRPELAATLDLLGPSHDAAALAQQAAELPDERWDPERAALATARHSAVHRWLTETLPPNLAAQLLDWAQRDRAGAVLPARLARRVRPYVGALANDVQEVEEDLTTALVTVATDPPGSRAYAGATRLGW